MLTIVLALLVAQAHLHDAAEHTPPPIAKEAAPKPRGATVDLQVSGQTSPAYLAKPKAAPKGAVLVIHEWWGLTDWVKHMADELADEGYLALAVDLYRGKVTKDPKEASALMQAKDEKWGDAVEEAGLEWLKANAQGAKLATVGWCMGGGESLKASLNDPKDVAATVIFYGYPTEDVAKLKTLKGPVLGLWGKEDKGIPPSAVQAFDKALTEAGVKHEFHSWDAGHGFANPSSGAYQTAAAKEAWAEAKKFLGKTLRK